MRWTEYTQFGIRGDPALIMLLSRFGATLTCVVLLEFMIMIAPFGLGQPQNQVTTSIVTQQAVTQIQVTQQAQELTKLQNDLESQRTVIGSLREDLSTVRGIGIGAASVIGLLQTLQMILQVRAVRKGV